MNSSPEATHTHARKQSLIRSQTCKNKWAFSINQKVYVSARAYTHTHPKHTALVLIPFIGLIVFTIAYFFISFVHIHIRTFSSFHFVSILLRFIVLATFVCFLSSYLIIFTFRIVCMCLSLVFQPTANPRYNWIHKDTQTQYRVVHGHCAMDTRKVYLLIKKCFFVVLFMRFPFSSKTFAVAAYCCCCRFVFIRNNKIKSDKNNDAEKENTCFVVAGESSVGGVLCFFLFALLLFGCCLLHCTPSISMCTSVARFSMN